MDLDKHLIREVKSHAVLYDSNHSKYKDIDFKQQTWIEIGRKLIGSEDNVTSVNALKVRWKSLRDAYVKERKYDISKSCGIKVKAKKPWRLKKQMEFLAPFIQNRKDLTIDVSNAEENVGHSTISAVHEVDDLDSTNDNVSIRIEEPDNFVCHEPDFSKCEYFSGERKVTEIESFFRGISDVVLGLSRQNQIFVQKEIATLVMNLKLRELEAEESPV